MVDFWPIIKAFWPILAIVGVVLVIRLILEIVPELISRLIGKIKSKKRIAVTSKWLSDRELMWMLRGMNPSEFEDYVADLFSKLGYKIETTGGPYDEGVDVIAEKNGIKHYIQCKKYITSTVGVKEVRDFYGAIADHLANGKGYFITTNKFTLEAEKFAEDKPIELIDGNRLIEYIHLAEKS
jgi:restriction system protein